MITLQNQNNFGRGQISQRVQSRIKDEIYEGGVLIAENCFVEPSGVLKKRYGTKFVEDLTSVGPIFKLIPFEYSPAYNYLLVFYPGFVQIYQKSNLLLVATLATVFDADSIPTLRYDQSVSTMVICDGKNIPQQLTLAVPLLTWSIANITFINTPTYDFNKNYYDFTFTPTAKYGTVTIASSDDVFYAALVGGLFIAMGGVARITAYTDTKHITVVTLGETFFNTTPTDLSAAVTAINGKNVVIKEPMWSATRGWPTNPCLHDNRLWFGGTQLRPQSVCGSVVGDFYNFDEGSGLPDYCINTNIDSKLLNSINHLVSADTLQILTNTGIYVLDIDSNGNIKITPECKEGSSDVNPIFIDSQLLYAQRGGKIVRNFLYNFQIQGYDNSNVSIYSSDLINNPVDSSALKYNDNESTNYVFFINEDGTLSTYQTERAEKISAWTPQTTGISESFVNCAAVDNSLFFIIKRIINEEEKYYLEEMDSTVYLDCYLTFHSDLSTDVVTGLGALEGRTVTVIRDGHIENDKVVTDGQIISDEPGNNFIVGLKILSRIVPLPLGMDTNSGPTTYVTKTIRSIYLDMVDTFGVKINGDLIPYFYMDNYILNSIYTGFTGVAKYAYLKDWQNRQNIEITHDYPTPFTLCGIGYEVITSIPQ